MLPFAIYSPNGAEAWVAPVKRRQERRPRNESPLLSTAEVPEGSHEHIMRIDIDEAITDDCN